MRNISLLLRAINHTDNKAFNNVKVTRISKNNVVYLEDEFGKVKFLHTSKMPNLVNYIESLEEVLCYMNKFEKLVNYYAYLDLQEFKKKEKFNFDYEKAYIRW